MNSKAATKSEMCSIVVVSPLVTVIRDKLEQIKKLGSIGLGEELEENEKAARKSTDVLKIS